MDGITTPGTRCLGGGEQAAQSLVESALEVLPVDALRRHEQVGRQAGRGVLELEPDQPPVGEREVREDVSGKCAVGLKQQAGPSTSAGPVGRSSR
jgi:hypothetical protein